MTDIFGLLNANLDNLNEEERRYVEEFTDKLKENIIEELVEVEAARMIKDAKQDKEKFVEDLGQILIQGCKGFNKMPIQLLIDIYLEKKTDIDFMNLLEKIH